MKLRAIETFFARDRKVCRGDLVESDDPITAGREALFVADDVEQATAAPGELRSVKRPARKRAAKPKS